MINKKINRLYIVFLIIGIIITSIGLYTNIKTLDNSNKVDTIGTITSIVSTSNDTPGLIIVLSSIIHGAIIVDNLSISTLLPTQIWSSISV